MRKETLKQKRNEMINQLWDKNKNEMEMKEIAYIFNISLPQTYRIIKNKGRSKNKN